MSSAPLPMSRDADRGHLDRLFALFHWLHDVVKCCATCSMDLAIIQTEKERGTNQPPVRSRCQDRKGVSVCEAKAREAWKAMPRRPAN